MFWNLIVELWHSLSIDWQKKRKEGKTKILSLINNESYFQLDRKLPGLEEYTFIPKQPINQLDNIKEITMYDFGFEVVKQNLKKYNYTWDQYDLFLDDFEIITIIRDEIQNTCKDPKHFMY